MNMRKHVVLSGLLISLGVWSAAISADDSSAMGTTPEPKTENGITYVTGGVGSDQAQALKSAAKDYTLMLTFAAQPSGEYLADVKVKITGKSGAQILDTVADGPMLLAKLPPGQYRISAESDGRILNKTVQVSAKHVDRVTLYWPEHKSSQSSQNDRGL